MSNIIDKIRVSGTDYTLSATSSGGNPTIEVTQAEYDALVSAGTVQEDTYYIITDSSIDYINSAQCQSQIDSSISGKADTSAVTEAIDAAVSGKVSTNDFNTYSGAVDTAINSKASQSTVDTLNGVVTAHTADTSIHLTSGDVQSQIDNSISGKVNVSDNVVSAYSFDRSTKIAYPDIAAWRTPSIPSGTKKISISFTMLPANNQLFETLQFVTFNPFGFADVASGLTVGVAEDTSTFPFTYTVTSVTWTGDDSVMSYDISENDTLLNLYAQGDYIFNDVVPKGMNVLTMYIDVLEDIESGQTAEVVNDGVVKNFENIGKYLQYERNRVNSELYSKLDTTAYTPVVIDSSLIQGSTNPVEGGALFNELRVQTSPGEGETTITFDSNNYSTNYPLGCTSLKVNVGAVDEFVSIYFYNSSNTNLGEISVANFGGINVTNNTLPGATYEISGNIVTLSYPPQGIVKIEKMYSENFSFSAVNPPVYDTLKNVVDGKQDALVSGTNIKTINNESILGSGNITIQSEVSSAITSGDTNAVAGGAVYDKFDEVEQVTAAALNALNANKQDKLSAGTGIEISGNVISATGGGGGNPTVELTQAEYDALVSAGTVSADTYYIITDATPVDMSNYYTSAQTESAITQAVSGKQDTLSAGRGISIYSNTISFELPISAGTGSNSIKENYSNNTASGEYSHAEGRNTTASGSYSHAEGYNTSASTNSAHAEGLNTKAYGAYSHAEGYSTKASGGYSHAEGGNTTASTDYAHSEGAYTNASGTASHTEGYSTNATGSYSHAEGRHTTAQNEAEHTSGRYNVSSKANATFGDSGNTLFSVGNGEDSEYRHNALDIRQNGDIYIVDTSASGDYYTKPMIKLQESLGGTVSSAITRGDTNAVAGGAVYDRFNEVEQVTAQALNVLNESLTGKADSSAITEEISAAVSGKTDFSAFTAHTADTTIHVTAQDKTNWNNKSNFSGSYNDLSNKPTIPTSASQLTNDTGYITSSDISGKVDISVYTAYTAATNTALNNKVSTSNVTSAVTSGSTDVLTSGGAYTQFGGLKLLKLSQSEYNALSPNYDNNTLYVIVN